MKDFISPAYTFTPGASGVGTVNLSGISAFNIRLLVAIINQTRGVTIYATGSTATRYTGVTGTTLTLFFDTSAQGASDVLQVIYNQPDTASNQVTTLGQDSSYAPKYTPPTTTTTKTTSVDTTGNLVVRSTVLTDEASVRVNFNGSALAVSLGAATRSGRVISGISYNLSDVHPGDYFKYTADNETFWTQIASIDSNTQLTLAADYTGFATGNTERSIVRPYTAAGGSVTVANGRCILTVPTTTDVRNAIIRTVDYGPLVFRAGLNISQRINNQNVRIGLAENTVNSIQRWFARFRADGANTFTIMCESGSNPTSQPTPNETESTTITLPDGKTTLDFLEYRIEQTLSEVRYFVNDNLVAKHTKRIPTPYDLMAGAVILDNTGATGSSTTVNVDYMSVENFNQLETSITSPATRVVSQQPDLATYNYTFTGAIGVNTDLLIINCEKIKSLLIHCISVGTGGVVTAQWSNNGVDYYSAGTTGTDGFIASTITGTGVRLTPVYGRFLRLRLTNATTALTTAFSVTGSQTILGDTANQLSTVTNVGATNVGSYTRYRNTNVAATVITVKATAGNLYGVNLVNTNASTACYFKLFDAASVTLGTTAPVEVVVVPANTVVFFEPKIAAFSYHSNSIKIAATLGLADSSVTGPATDLYVELKYT